MSTYRIAIIGTGRVGYQFSFSDLPDNHAAAVVQHPSCELAAGVNRGREKLDAFGERFGVAALYHDYRQMLAEVQPDICIVATHPELHAEMVTVCAQAASTRAIICEKPMALSLEECDQMIAACQAEDVLLQINHTPPLALRMGPRQNAPRRRGYRRVQPHLLLHGRGQAGPLVAQRKRRPFTARLHPLFRPNGSLRRRGGVAVRHG